MDFHPDGDDAVSRSVGRRLPELQSATGLACVFGGATRPSTDDLDQVVIDQLVGMSTPAMNGLTVVAGRGLGGQAMLRRKPCVVRDYTGSRSITHDYDDAVVVQEKLRSVLAVPVLVRGRVRAVLYGAIRDGIAIGDTAVRAAGTVAERLAGDLGVLLRTPSGPAAGGDYTDLAALDDLSRIARLVPDQVLRRRLERIHRKLSGARHTPGGARLLTQREMDVLRVIATGTSNVTAGDQLGLSAESVKTYLRNAMRKLGVNNRTAAVYEARSRGLL
ncbi:LuxR C-terminal-related transcriptional regulator [Pseudonocardia tropica]|uniref:LuxR C-terminal-related transcriptional regulator n=1 Tax=Pseudonocardia tropica TaxID=681289 RepID=A0ABV1K075_9PSEU